MAEWDSLAHIAFIELLEREFERSVPPERVSKLRSVDSIHEWLRSGEEDDAGQSSEIAASEIEEALRAVGLGEGDLVMVHSFTSALTGLERPDRRLIDALLEILGDGGTLALPAFTYSFCRTGIFRPDEDPSEVGIAADTLRNEYRGRRTLAPIFSVVVAGARSDEIAELSSATTFGPDSIFGYMLQHNGKLCGVGVGCEKITFNHYPEQQLAVPYRYWKHFTGVMEHAGQREPISVQYFVRSLEPEAVRDQSKISALMSDKPFVRTSSVGGADIFCAPVEQYHATLRDAMIEDPLFQLSDGTRVHWE